jgi:hypothetical protein
MLRIFWDVCGGADHVCCWAFCEEEITFKGLVETQGLLFFTNHIMEGLVMV